MDNTTKLRDELTGALIGIARATDNNVETSADTWRIMIEGLCAAADANGNEKSLREQIELVHAEKARLVPDCVVCTSPCGRTADYNMAQLRRAPENIRRIKSEILTDVRVMALRVQRAMTPGGIDAEVGHLFALALFAVGEDWNTDELQAIVMELSKKMVR